MSDAKTIVFFPEGAFGPTNNCVGIGQVLKARGHRVVFIVEESFAGTLEAKGFEERLMRLGPPPEVPEVPGQFWIDFIRDTSPVFRKPTIEQLGEFIAPTWQALIDGSKYVDPRLPRSSTSSARRHRRGQRRRLPGARRLGPAVGADRLVQPRRDEGPAIAPFSSGYPAPTRVAGRLPRRGRPDPSRHVGRLRRVLPRARRSGLSVRPAWPGVHLGVALAEPVPVSGRGRLRARSPLGPTWHRLDSSVRAAETTWELPEHLRARDGSLIYLSLGSLGSADVALMQRLVDLLATTEHRVIVSKGPLADQITLHDNQTGEGFLPQPAILPQVDLVITHGGNNTVTEAFHHGKPMIVLPLFWDQVDNAQRVDEPASAGACRPTTSATRSSRRHRRPAGERCRTGAWVDRRTSSASGGHGTSMPLT